MEADEILYADDTLCIFEDEEALNRLLAAIETEGNRYRLKLNKGKCEYLTFGPSGRIKLKDDTLVPKKSEVEYLGCNMNDNADPEPEIIGRRTYCVITFIKLYIFIRTLITQPRGSYKWSTQLSDQS